MNSNLLALSVIISLIGLGVILKIWTSSLEGFPFFWLFLVCSVLPKGSLPDEVVVSSEVKVKASNDKFMEETQKRLLKAMLPVIILKSIENTGVISPPNMIIVIKKQYNLQISPGTIYPIFRKLEKDGKITKLKHRKCYMLTAKGKETITCFQRTIQNIELVFDKLRQ